MSAVSASTPQGAIISKTRLKFKLHQCAGLPRTCIASHLAQEYQPHQRSQSSPLAATLATSSSVPSCPPQNQALQPPRARPPHLAMASSCLSSSRSSISPVHSGMLRQAQALGTKARVQPRSSMHSTGRGGSMRMKCRKRRMRMSSSVSVTVRYVYIAEVHFMGNAKLVKSTVGLFAYVLCGDGILYCVATAQL